MKSPIERAREVLDIEAGALHTVQANIGTAFEEAVALFVERSRRGNKIVVAGVGKNLHIGQKIAATLTSTGTPAVTLHPGEAMHGDLGILARGDVLLALSYSGASDELLSLVPAARREDIAVVSLTGDAGSPLALASDIVLSVAVEREACPFNMAPTASTTATLALGDALAMVVLEAKGFSQEDYAKLHPGGAIGRTLLLRVRDLMRTGDRFATVDKSARVRDAVVAMTSCKCGAVAVIRADRTLAGILTDGDLRRHLTETPDLMERPVTQIMTRDPITIHDEDLAVDVLRQFESHRIDDLIVLDSTGKVAGQIDIQDLPKLKIL